MLRAGNVHSAHRLSDDWIRSCLATGRQECAGTFGPMPHSPSRTSMSTWRSGESSTPYGLPSNKVLQYEIAPLLIRPVERPPFSGINSNELPTIVSLTKCKLSGTDLLRRSGTFSLRP